MLLRRGGKERTEIGLCGGPLRNTLPSEILGGLGICAIPGSLHGRRADLPICSLSICCTIYLLLSSRVDREAWLIDLSEYYYYRSFIHLGGYRRCQESTR